MRGAPLAIVLVMIAGCPPQKPPPSGYYPRPGYSNAGTSPSPFHGDPIGGDTYGVGYHDPYAPFGGGLAGPTERRFSFNGHVASAEDLRTLARIERMYGQLAPEGDYWYDAKSGAAGPWGGPALGFLPAGLALGGALPATASGGGDGRLTGVFVNGRELHPVDVQVLERIYGQVVRGRLWIDAQGNAGPEGGVAFVNLIVLAKQRGRGAESYVRSDGRGNNAFAGGGCVSVSGTDPKTYAFYDAGC